MTTNEKQVSAGDLAADRLTSRKIVEKFRGVTAIRSVAAHPLFLAAVTGLLLAFAAPPWDVWPLALVALAPLLVALRDAAPSRAAAFGFAAGLVFHGLAQAWWPGVIQRFTELAWLPSLAISAGFIALDAAALGAWAGVSAFVVRRGRAPWVLAAPLAIGVVDAVWPSFFEWHLGVLLWRAWPLVQVAEVGGGAAVSALLVLASAVVVELALALRDRRAPARSAFVGAGVLAAVLALGLARAQQITVLQADAPRIEVGLVQPNFGPLTRDERSREARHLVAALQQATQQIAAEGVDLLVWSESAWPLFWDRRLEQDFPERHPWSLRERAPSAVLAGALTHPFGSAELYNSAVLLRSSGEVAGTYDKRMLVPFSEYVPLGERYPGWKEAVQRHVPDRPEITRGRGAAVLADGSLRLAPLICSEDLSSEAAVAAAREGANLLVSMANDGWFLDSAAVHQHLALSALRAVEARRSLVRVTTHGVSAHVDAVGRVRLEGPVVPVGPGERKPPTLLRSRVSLMSPPSLATLTLPYFPHACAAALAGVSIWGHGRRRTRRRSKSRR